MKLAAAATLLTAWVPAVLGVYEIVQVIRTVAEPQVFHFGTPVFFLVTAALLSLVVKPLLAGRAWARSVVITWLLVFAFAATTLIRSLGPLGWAGIAVAVAGVVGLALPSSWVFYGERRLPGEE